MQDTSERGNHISSMTWRPCVSSLSVRAEGRCVGLTYIDGDLRPIRVFDGGVITLDPLVVNELCCGGQHISHSCAKARDLGFLGSHPTCQTALPHAA